jgi:hypothetical protein
VEKGELVRVDGDNPKDAVAEQLFLKVMELLKSAKGFVYQR